ncbi:MFS general substrate transporter [Xylariaceae sp. FL0804]|nr:MFS general substrate transporter [Xylariaceae sp. FL0804]
MVALSCVATLLTSYTAGAYTQPAAQIAAATRSTQQGALAGVTTFCLGFALAPMALAPFSETHGRRPVFNAAGAVFAVFQAVCGAVCVPGALPALLVARFVKGAAGSVFSTMVGGVIADMYAKEDRNTPMALFSGSVLVGTGLGPLVAAHMVQIWGDQGGKWKWVFWHQVILDFVLMIAIMIFFKESRGCVLLSRKASALNKWYDDLEKHGVYGTLIEDASTATCEPHGEPDERNWSGKGVMDWEKTLPAPRHGSVQQLRRIRWIVKEDEQRGSIGTMIRVSLVRPFHLLFTEPVVFFFSLWVAFAWAVLYLMFESIPIVFSRQYGFNTGQSGLVFLAIIVGSIIATIIGVCQENMLHHPRWRAKAAVEGSLPNDSSDDGGRGVAERGAWAFVRRKFPVESPEARLYLTCFSSILLPVGLYLFGFAAHPSVHWMVPAVAICLATMGIYFVYLSTFNYLADIYQAYASSALAAQSFCRNVLGGVFPLVSGYMITSLGENGTGGLLGGIATALTVVPWALVLYGETIRRRSAFAIALEGNK